MQVSDCWYKKGCPQYPDGCSIRCLRFTEMLNLVQKSNIAPSKWKPEALYADDDLEAFHQLRDIKNDIKNWVQEGNNLYLYSSNYGNGKTSWAIKLMLSYFNQIWAGNAFRCRGIFVSVSEFLDRNRSTMNNRDVMFLDMKEELITCDLVVWDDISSVKLTDFNHSILFNYIDARIAANRANIFTGNVDLKGLTDLIGGRLASRVYNSGQVIKFVDPDKRGGALGG